MDRSDSSHHQEVTEAVLESNFQTRERQQRKLGMVDADLSKILCCKGPISSCKGWRVAWPWGHGGPWVGVQGALWHHFPQRSHMTAADRAGYCWTPGCRVGMKAVCPVGGCSQGGCGVSSSALQLLGHQAGAGTQLAWSCCGWEVGTGDLWGPLPVAGAESDSTSGG